MHTMILRKLFAPIGIATLAMSYCIARPTYSAQAQVAPPQSSTLCRFTSGPRAGQVQDYAPQAPLPIGSPCQDGQGSTGTIVAAMSGQGMPAGSTSTLCSFTSGPRAGQVQDYAPQAPLPIGTPCLDHQGSTGMVVAPINGQGTVGTSTLCRFASGPRSGETQDYAPQAPLPIGTPCLDHQGSTGSVVAPASGQNAAAATSTLCRFTSGPRSGETQDYPQRQPLPIGTPCQDQQGSSGTIAAPTAAAVPLY